MAKTAGIRIRISPELHREFLDVCKLQDIQASQVLRQFMRLYVDQYQQERQSELFDINNILKNNCTYI